MELGEDVPVQEAGQISDAEEVHELPEEKAATKALSFLIEEGPCQPAASKALSFVLEEGPCQPADDEVHTMLPDEKAVTRALPSVIEDDLLRAVHFSEVVASFGSHFADKTATAQDYTLSKKVESIDAFISHDWCAPRVHKFITLCFFYNAKAACVCSVVVAVVTVIITISSSSVVRPQYVCPLAWWLCFLFWHRVRTVLTLRPVMMFLDKLCIHQTDEEKKKLGILALAGFLRKSRVMLILWSPRYFTRLWCAYELVSWFRLHENASTVIFLPISYAFALVMMVCFGSIYLALRSANIGYWNMFFEIVWLIPGLVLFLHSVIATRNVFEQISSFSIRSSKCFCCEHGHKHPKTGMPMVCDRKMVYKTLDNWFSPKRISMLAASEKCPDFLDAFDDSVRCGLRGMLKANGADMTSLMTYTDALIAACPGMWAALDELAQILSRRDEHTSVLFFVQVDNFFSVIFFIAPCALRSILLLIVFWEQRRPKLNNYRLAVAVDLLAWLCSVVLSLTICGCMFLTGPYFVWKQPLHIEWWLRCLRNLLFACFTLLVFGGFRRCGLEMFHRKIDTE
eukprot:TRINITY_DN8925_c0_g1_i1.p1 TRINITY_DN8925_c0_g1~~TRINITY_DN8925_c0_g1_i1.p1  ORF type:complete len:578 (+),score=40.15 TRINITY_DN8925_c0_g1_i1:29-1735(+)